MSGLWSAMENLTIKLPVHSNMPSSCNEYKEVEGSHGGLLDLKGYLEIFLSSYSARLGHLASKQLVTPSRDSKMVRGGLQTSGS